MQYILYYLIIYCNIFYTSHLITTIMINTPVRYSNRDENKSKILLLEMNNSFILVTIASILEQEVFFKNLRFHVS